MPRQIRIEYDGTTYHVMARANLGGRLFLPGKLLRWLLLPTIFLAVLAATSGLAIGGSLEYAPAPPDNPLRGLVPYVSASDKWAERGLSTKIDFYWADGVFLESPQRVM